MTIGKMFTLPVRDHQMSLNVEVERSVCECLPFLYIYMIAVRRVSAFSGIFLHNLHISQHRKQTNKLINDTIF